MAMGLQSHAVHATWFLGKTHLIKTWLVDGQGVAVPGIDTSLVHVYDNYLAVRSLAGDHRHRGAAHIPAGIVAVTGAKTVQRA